ncbi:MAG: ComEC/Rec2 family competence protein [Faecousia sp.]
MKKLLISLATAVLCVLLALLFPETAPETPDVQLPISGNGMTVHFIDVGQADCALVECDGEYLLIDGGNVADSQMVVSYLNQMRVDRLSVVCSHAHEDHVGGLPAVLSVFDAEAVYAPVTDYTSKVFANFVEKTQDQGLSVTVPAPGDQFTVGSATVTVLGPVKDYEETNDTSIVLKLSYGQSDFLFTGDMEVAAENDMLDYWGEDFDWDMEVLKVGHHGSDTSSGYRFVYEVNPAYGVISVGQGNSYNHPCEVTLSRLKDAGVTVFRTDYLGHVIAQTDGSEITFTWENQNAAPEDVEPADPAMTRVYGNRKSKKFHTWDCRNLPAESNRVTFDSYDEAVSQGYTPCGNCIG